MTTIVTRTGKGSPLTHVEVDTNFTNLNTAKLETLVAAAGAGSAAAPSISFTGDTNTGLFSPGADTLAFAEGGVEAMRIDSSGRVGIGVVPAGYGENSRLTLDSTGLTNAIYSNFNGTGNDTHIFLTNGGSALCYLGTDNTSLTFGVGNTERARIDSSGRLLVGTSSSTDAKLVVANGSEQQVSFKIDNTNSSPVGVQIRYGTDVNGAGNRFIDCIGNATTRFLVFSSGNVQNTNNSYAGISDLKLKENIVESSSQWDDLKTLQVKNFNFIGDNNKQIGLVAQQVEQVCPGLVEESTDLDETGADLGTVTKSVKYSVLYMKAVRALQEAMERIEVLEQRLTDAGIA